MSLVAVKIHNLCFGDVFFKWKNGAEGVAVFWQLFGLPTRLVVCLNDVILKPSSMTTKKNTHGLRFDDASEIGKIQV